MSHATTAVSTRLGARLEREIRALRRHARLAWAGDPAGVHQARVASRRVREMLAVAAAADAGAPALLREVRRVGRALGPIRELDVSREVWTSRAGGAAWPATVVTRLERRAAADRRRLEPAMHEALDRFAASDVRRRLGRLQAVLAESPHDRQLRAALGQSVRRRAGDLGAAAEAAGTVYAPAALHDVRIAAKKLRYALELARHLAQARLARPLRDMKAQQDLLGELHDLQVVQQRLQALATGRGVSLAALGAFKTAAMDLEGECRALHARFVAGAAAFLVTVSAARAATAVALAQPAARRMSARSASRIEKRAATGDPGA